MTDVTVRRPTTVNTPYMTLSTDTHVDRRHEALALIESFGTIEPDGLVSTRVVTDALLDLRAVVGGTDRLVVEAVLGAVPGVNVVESGWWRDQLDGLRDLLGPTAPRSDEDRRHGRIV